MTITSTAGGRAGGRRRQGPGASIFGDKHHPRPVQPGTQPRRCDPGPFGGGGRPRPWSPLSPAVATRDPRTPSPEVRSHARRPSSRRCWRRRARPPGSTTSTSPTTSSSCSRCSSPGPSAEEFTALGGCARSPSTSATAPARRPAPGHPAETGTLVFRPGGATDRDLGGGGWGRRTLGYTAAVTYEFERSGSVDADAPHLRRAGPPAHRPHLAIRPV